MKKFGDKNFLMLCLQLMLIILLSAFVAAIIGIGITKLFDGSNMTVLKITQGISQIFIFLLPPIIFLNINKVDIKDFLGFNIKLSWQVVVLCILLLPAILPFVDWLVTINEKLVLPSWMSGIEDWMIRTQMMSEEIVTTMLSVSSVWALLLNILIIALIPAVSEELMFRGVFQKMLTNKMRNPHWAIIITSIIFSAVHLEFYSFLPRVILGMVLGYSFYFSGNIIIPIIIHFVNNSISIITYYCYFNYVSKGEPFNSSDISEYSNIYFALISFVISVGIMYLIKVQSDKNKQNIIDK